MLTPQEVSERAFQKASFGGYNMSQVDEFLDILTGDYSALYNENAVLKNKMKVLVDKVEEYRATEEAMRKALLAAQRMADDLVKEAEQKKDALLAQTERDVDTRRAELAKALEAEEYRLKKAQEETAAFVEKVRALHAQEAEYLSHLDELCPPRAASASDEVAEKASEIDDNVQRLLAKAMEDAAAENSRLKAVQEEEDLSDTAEYPVGGASYADEEFPPEDGDYEDEDYEREDYEEDDDEDSDPRPPAGSRIDFGQLQFGQDYEIT